MTDEEKKEMRKAAAKIMGDKIIHEKNIRRAKEGTEITE
jgi:hypothetical protein